MALNVMFLTGTKDKYLQLAVKDPNTFYRVTYDEIVTGADGVQTTVSRYDLYLGEELLSSGNVTDKLASEVGDIADLTTTAKNTVVAAINELDAEMGPLTDLSADLTAAEKETIVKAINAVWNRSKITVEKQASAEAGFIATYFIKQNGKKVGDSINIPKDYLVKSASIKMCETPDVPLAGLRVDDKYLDFVVNTLEDSGNESHLYINLTELVEDFTVQASATEVQLAIDEADTNGYPRILSASLVDGGITNVKIANGTIAREKIDATFEADIKALEDAVGSGGSVDSRIQTAIEALDSQASQTGVFADNGNLNLDITLVDGKVTSLTGNIPAQTYDTFGSAAAVLGESTDAKETMTVNGVKNYVDYALTWNAF